MGRKNKNNIAALDNWKSKLLGRRKGQIITKSNFGDDETEIVYSTRIGTYNFDITELTRKEGVYYYIDVERNDQRDNFNMTLTGPSVKEIFDNYSQRYPIATNIL